MRVSDEEGKLPPCLASMTLIILSIPFNAMATLGGDAISIQADQMHTKAAHRVIAQTEKYTLHELRVPSGTVIREYSSPTGTVFGVAWQGPSVPDLRQVLGEHFEQYMEAAKSQRHGHGPILIQQPGLVVQSGGHMRAFVGKAYIPDLLPQAITAETIR
jgi:hypothetical protein